MSERFKGLSFRNLRQFGSVFFSVLAFSLANPGDVGAGQSLSASHQCEGKDLHVDTINRIDDLYGTLRYTSHPYGILELSTDNLDIIKMLNDLHGRDFWEGYESQYGGWDVPAKYLFFDKTTRELVLKRNRLPKEHLLAWQFVPGKNGEVYLMLFSDASYRRPNADANGQHWGIHPEWTCAVPATDWDMVANSIATAAQASPAVTPDSQLENAPVPPEIELVVEPGVSDHDIALANKSRELAKIRLSQIKAYTTTEYNSARLILFKTLDYLKNNNFPGSDKKAKEFFDTYGATSLTYEDTSLIDVGTSWWNDPAFIPDDRKIVQELLELWHGAQDNLEDGDATDPGWLNEGSALAFAADSYPAAKTLLDQKALGRLGQMVDAKLSPRTLQDKFSVFAVKNSGGYEFAYLAAKYLRDITKDDNSSRLSHYYVLMGQGKSSDTAFSEAFGLTISDFYDKFDIYFASLVRGK